MEKLPALLSRSGVSPASPPRSAPPPEVELKLLVSPTEVERIRTASVIVQHARNRGVVRRLEAVYYDTPDRALSRQGGSLRVRRNGTRYVQTLKLAGAGQAPARRREWETPVNTPAPDLTRLPVEIDASLGEIDKNGLAPVFTTRVRRHARRLAFNGAEIEITFDEGMLEAASSASR